MPPTVSERFPSLKDTIFDPTHIGLFYLLFSPIPQGMCFDGCAGPLHVFISGVSLAIPLNFFIAAAHPISIALFIALFSCYFIPITRFIDATQPEGKRFFMKSIAYIVYGVDLSLIFYLLPKHVGMFLVGLS